MSCTPPVVLSISGHDPSGGAGIQADIEAITQHSCHACSVITALTIQNTTCFKKIIPQSADHILEQLQALLDDIDISAIKIGLLGSEENIYAVHEVIQTHPNIPVIIDPVLASGLGNRLVNDTQVKILKSKLLPNATVITPNSIEARTLAGNLTSLKDCGLKLLATGCKNVLITGTHEMKEKVVNSLYSDSGAIESRSWDRLNHTYHGSGCTLASSIAALIALGHDPASAALDAQAYTWKSLKNAYKPGKGQYIPRRLFGSAYR